MYTKDKYNQGSNKYKNNYNREHYYYNYTIGDSAVKKCPLIDFKPTCTIKMCLECSKTNYKKCYKYLGIDKVTK